MDEPASLGPGTILAQHQQEGKGSSFNRRLNTILSLVEKTVVSPYKRGKNPNGSTPQITIRINI